MCSKCIKARETKDITEGISTHKCGHKSAARDITKRRALSYVPTYVQLSRKRGLPWVRLEPLIDPSTELLQTQHDRVRDVRCFCFFTLRVNNLDTVVFSQPISHTDGLSLFLVGRPCAFLC